jgi:hypothetical protein
MPNFILANHTKQEVVVPRDIGLEPSQRFHVGFDGSLADAMYILTSLHWQDKGADWPKVNDACGRWAGDKVIVLSDNDEDKRYINYAVMRYRYENISHLVREAFSSLFGIQYEEVKSGESSVGWKRLDLT